MGKNKHFRKHFSSVYRKAKAKGAVVFKKNKYNNFKIKKDNKVSKSLDGGLYRFYKIILLIAMTFTVLSFAVSIKKGFNKGLDFAGGIVVEVACNNGCNKVNIEGIKDLLQKKLGFSITYQEIEDGYVFKTPFSGENYNNTLKTIQDVIVLNNKQSKNQNIKIVRMDYVSSQMSASFIKDSIIACIFSFACIGLYVIVRFNWRFAVAGILTLIFDVVLVIACISILNIEVCLTTLTGLLLIIGYCINDKIVVFDRIRGNLLNKEPVIEIVKRSTKMVLTRSVLTSLTTAIATTSLLFFGDKFIYELGLIILFGIFFGTISSLTVAPSILLALKLKHMEMKAEKEPMFFAS